jgi:hypothetical protein
VGSRRNRLRLVRSTTVRLENTWQHALAVGRELEVGYLMKSGPVERVLWGVKGRKGFHELHSLMGQAEARDCVNNGSKGMALVGR